ncbi:MAG: LptF/LptG family permease [Gemmatimonadales bacterium]
MTILSRYLVRLHVVPFVFTLTALTSLLLLNQIAKRFGSFVGKGIPWTVIAEFFTLSIPFLLAMTIPMSVLVTVLYTFSRLAADKEITALRAAGVSVVQMMRPVIAASMVVAAGAFLVSDQLVPRTNHRLRTLMMDIDRKKPALAIKEQVINEVERNKIFLRASRVDVSTYRMMDVTIYDLTNPERKRIIYADSGEMAFAVNQEDLQVTLFDGVMHEIDLEDRGVFQQIEFNQNVIRVENVGNSLQRTETDGFRGDREMGVCELRGVIATARNDALLAERRATATRINFLRSLVGLEAVPPDTVLPPADLGFYCARIEPLLTGSFVQSLEAQEPQDSGSARLLQRFNAPARQAFLSGAVTRIPYNELQALQTRIVQARTRQARNMVEVHKKYAISVACIVFVIIGVPVALRFPRGGVDLVIGVSIVVIGMYYVQLIAGEALGDRLAVDPAIAMWLADFLFTGVGIFLLHRMRVSTVPRDMTWWGRWGASSA